MTAGTLLLSLGVSLALTLFIELVFALITGKRGSDLALAALVNVLTNPVVVYLTLLVRHASAMDPRPVVLSLEAAAVLVEGALYRARGRNFPHPFLFSLCANALSFGIGLIISFLQKG